MPGINAQVISIQDELVLPKVNGLSNSEDFYLKLRLFEKVIKESLAIDNLDKEKLQEITTGYEELKELAKSSQIPDTQLNKELLRFCTNFYKEDVSSVINIESTNSKEPKILLNELLIIKTNYLDRLDRLNAVLIDNSFIQVVSEKVSSEEIVKDVLEGIYRSSVSSLKSDIADKKTVDIDMFCEKEKRISYLMSQLDSASMFDEIKLSRSSDLYKVLFSQMGEDLKVNYKNYNLDSGIDRTNAINSNDLLVKEYIRYGSQLLPSSILEKFEAELNSLNNLYNARIECSFAAEVILEDLFEQGVEIDADIVRNILTNTIDRIRKPKGTYYEADNDSLSVVKIIEQGISALDSLSNAPESQKLDYYKELIFELSNIGEPKADSFGRLLEKHFFGFSKRFEDILRVQVENALLGKLSKDSWDATVAVFNTDRMSFIKVIDAVKYVDQRDKVPVLEASLAVIISAMKELSDNNKEPAFVNKDLIDIGALRSEINSSMEYKLRAIRVALDLDRGIDPTTSIKIEEIQARAISFYMDLANRQFISYSKELGSFSRLTSHSELDPIIFNYFPSPEQLDKGGVTDLEHIRSMEQLYKLSPMHTGQMVSLYIDSMTDMGARDKALDYVRQSLLGNDSSTKLFDQLGLPRLLNRQSQDSALNSAVLEFLVGFSGSDKARHRSQIDLFHSLTNKKFIDQFPTEFVLRAIESK